MNANRHALRLGRLLIAGLVLAGVARGQESGSVVPADVWRRAAWPWAVRVPAEAVTEARGTRVRSPELDLALFDVRADEGLAAALAVAPPPVSRALLEGSVEGLQPYHGLPGGIVLGLAARAEPELERELVGARIERQSGGGIVLRLADGRRLRCPEIAPETLSACLAFTAERSDALVDLVPWLGARPRLAPAFEGSALAPLLVRKDAVPHAVRPETRAYKSVIVDRAVGIGVRSAQSGDELVLSADLEVRLYGGDDTGLARRARTLEATGPEFVGPRCTSDLAAELAPLAELAGWLGFLRRMERLDPAGIAALRSGVEFTPPSGASARVDPAPHAP